MILTSRQLFILEKLLIRKLIKSKTDREEERERGRAGEGGRKNAKHV